MTLSRRTALTGLASLPFLSAPSLLMARSKFKDNSPVEFGRRGPSSFAVHGIDAARFQGQMNWRQVKRQGVKFAWLKATEGGDLVDPEFKANWPTVLSELLNVITAPKSWSTPLRICGSTVMSPA